MLQKVKSLCGFIACSIDGNLTAVVLASSPKKIPRETLKYFLLLPRPVQLNLREPENNKENQAIAN